MATMGDLRREAKELGIPAPFGTTKEQLQAKIDDATTASIEPRVVTRELINPNTTESQLMDSTVHKTLTEEQRRAKLEQEIREKIEWEEIEKRTVDLCISSNFTDLLILSYFADHLIILWVVYYIHSVAGFNNYVVIFKYHRISH